MYIIEQIWPFTIILLLLVDEESVPSKDKIIIKDISNVPVFKSFHFKCSAYTSRIYLYDEVCRLMILCETKSNESLRSINNTVIDWVWGQTYGPKDKNVIQGWGQLFCL